MATVQQSPSSAGAYRTNSALKLGAELLDVSFASFGQFIFVLYQTGHHSVVAGLGIDHLAAHAFDVVPAGAALPRGVGGPGSLGRRRALIILAAGSRLSPLERGAMTLDVFSARVCQLRFVLEQTSERFVAAAGFGHLAAQSVDVTPAGAALTGGLGGPGWLGRGRGLNVFGECRTVGH